MERLTQKNIGCFEYNLKVHESVPGEFNTYDAFFDYTMVVKRLGELEDSIELDLLRNGMKINITVAYDGSSLS